MKRKHRENPYTGNNRPMEQLPSMRIVNRYTEALRVPILDDRWVAPGEIVEVAGWQGWSLCRGGMTFIAPPVPTDAANFWPATDADHETFRRAELMARAQGRKRASNELQHEPTGYAARCPKCRHLLARVGFGGKVDILSKCGGWMGDHETDEDLFLDGDQLECADCTRNHRGVSRVYYRFSYPRLGTIRDNPPNVV